MNSISLKEAAARWGVSERRISQLANEPGSGVWRVERGRYSFDPPQKGNHTIEAAASFKLIEFILCLYSAFRSQEVLSHCTE